jgi:hypothetical protein
VVFANDCEPFQHRQETRQWVSEETPQGGVPSLCGNGLRKLSWRGRRGGLPGFLIVSMVSACAQPSSDLNVLLNGPGPNLDGTAIGSYVDNRETVLTQISRDAGFDGRSPVSPSEWNQFVIAAFGYADAQCEDYLSALRRLDIARREATQQINLLGTATLGILGIVRAAATAIAITGVAFGLGQATVDNLTRGLLYDLPPSTVYDLVKRMKLAYESSLTAAAWQNRASSFRTISGYIELCLPLVIQANATNAVSVAQPVTVPGNPTLGTPPSVTPGPGTGGPSQQDIKTAVNQALEEHRITSPSRPIPPTFKPGPPPNGCRPPTECALAPSRIKQYQTALCVSPDGVFGTDTRTAIHDFLVANRTDPTDMINDRNKKFFDEAIGVNCLTDGFKSAYEVGLGVSKDRIITLQRDLGKLVKTTPAPGQTGVLDQPTRDAIAEICPPTTSRTKGTIDADCTDTINKQIRMQLQQPGSPQPLHQ